METVSNSIYKALAVLHGTHLDITYSYDVFYVLQEGKKVWGISENHYMYSRSEYVTTYALEDGTTGKLTEKESTVNLEDIIPDCQYCILDIPNTLVEEYVAYYVKTLEECE